MTALLDHQRAFMHMCFDAEPREAGLRQLGAERDRWLLYRDMVRTRLTKMARAGLPRTASALGDEAFDGWVAAWLADRAPRTRHIREIVGELLRWAIPRWNADPNVPAWLVDLAALELVRWEVGALDVAMPEAGDFAFDRHPVVNPTARVLELGHAVHESETAPPYPPVPTLLCVYRRADDDRTGVQPLGSFAAALLRALMPGDRTVTDAVRDVAERTGTPVDSALAVRLGSVLETLIRRGILLGAR